MTHVPLLFFTNLPYNCSEHELRHWIETRNIDVASLRIIRDLVSGASPCFGYAALKDAAHVDEAVAALDGKAIRNHSVLVRAAEVRFALQQLGVA